MDYVRSNQNNKIIEFFKPVKINILIYVIEGRKEKTGRKENIILI